MVRRYGEGPVQAVVVHGGPGAPGSVACVARELSKTCGVIEPMQSRHSIAELIDELDTQIRAYTQEAAVLIGHSWGAWLVVLLRGRTRTWRGISFLVGSGPFRAAYVPQIGARRLHNLSDEEGPRVFQRSRAVKRRRLFRPGPRAANAGTACGKGGQLRSH